MAKSTMNMINRAKMVKAMEFIVRNLNDESIFSEWLSLGVADGDIEYGDLIVDESVDDVVLDYIEDKDIFGELMGEFVDLMVMAKKSGGLYCGGVVSK